MIDVGLKAGEIQQTLVQSDCAFIEMKVFVAKAGDVIHESLPND